MLGPGSQLLLTPRLNTWSSLDYTVQVGRWLRTQLRLSATSLAPSLASPVALASGSRPRSNTAVNGRSHHRERCCGNSSRVGLRRRGAYRMLQPMSPLWQCSPPPQGLQWQPQLTTVRGCSMCTGAGCSQSGLSRWSGRRCRPPIMGLLWLWSPRAKVWSSIAAISKQLHNSSTERPECPLGVCLVTKAPQISWSAFHRRTRLREPVSMSGISCSRDRLRWNARRVMTSKSVPPAQPDTADQLPPNWTPRLAIPALALGASGSVPTNSPPRACFPSVSRSRDT